MTTFLTDSDSTAMTELSLNADPKRPFLVTAVDDPVYRHFTMPIRTH
jgi:hypothetical protein